VATAEEDRLSFRHNARDLGRVLINAQIAGQHASKNCALRQDTFGRKKQISGANKQVVQKLPARKG